MRNGVSLAISIAFLGLAQTPVWAADMALTVPGGATAGCASLALACENGRTYPICPIAVSVANELVTGRLLTGRGRGVHIRLIPMGDGYRYAGRGIWFDGKYTDATLFYSQRHAVACNVVGSTAEAQFDRD